MEKSTINNINMQRLKWSMELPKPSEICCGSKQSLNKQNPLSTLNNQTRLSREQAKALSEMGEIENDSRILKSKRTHINR